MKQLYLLLRIENGIATYSSPNPQIRPPIDRTRTAYMSGVLVLDKSYRLPPVQKVE